MDGTRRWFLSTLGKVSIAAAFFIQLAAAARAFLPNVLYEPLKRFKVKRPDQYPQGYTFDPDHRLFVMRKEDTFHVISAVCTHLGCTVQWRETEFACPCHGSHFNSNGDVTGGPAPRPLPWYEVSLSADGSLEIDTATQVASGSGYTLPKGKA